MNISHKTLKTSVLFSSNKALNNLNIDENTIFINDCAIDFALELCVNSHIDLLFIDAKFNKNSCKQNININLNKSHARLDYFCIDQIESNISSKTNLEIVHSAQNTISNQIFRGIYADNSMGYFYGKVIIKKNALHAEVKQNVKAILLGNNSRVEIMPQLEIYNNDIKASHGASIGELDKNALFYMNSRGIKISETKKMLLESFTRQVTENISFPDLRADLLALSHLSLQRILGKEIC